LRANQATLANEDFVQYLLASGALDRMAEQRVNIALKDSKQPIGTILLELGLLEEARLADCLSAFSGMERVHATQFPDMIPTDALIPAEFLKRSMMLPLAKDDCTVTFAVANPLDDTALRAAGYYMGLRPIAKIGQASEIMQHLKTLFAAAEDMPGILTEGEGHLEAVSNDLERLRDLATEAPVVKILSNLISRAIADGASDIHIEPLIDHVRVRYRIDGALLSAEPIDRSLQLALISRVKILARLNIAEQRLPQDGRIRLAVKGREVDFRVSTSPTIYGESVVLRILDRKASSLQFKALGFDEAAIQTLKRLLAEPNGILLVTGPTGSGKTTTLYAGLEILNQPSSKVFTVEDPIEYFLKGVNQILVRPQIGLDFASILRSVLRQDPDIIMVGEIRDPETATIAVQAALTGHLVLSSLHTNSAAASITRLRNIGIESYLIGSTVRAIIAQRLIRKLCKSCEKPHKHHAPSGCKACHGTGYSGRTVVYEILEITDVIRQAIEREAPDAEIEALAKKQGMISLNDCGLAKINLGETSREEVLRVVSGNGHDAHPV
jgi:general secretion pathway protein E